MNNRNLEVTKIDAMIQEVEASFEYIVLGLKTIKEQNSTISNNHVSLQLFASGFERIMKILLLIKDKYNDGTFPELSRAKSKFQVYDNGHGIEKMLSELIEYSDEVDHFQKIPMLIEDVEFLKSNIHFKSFIKIITEFSKQQRYYYIDTLVLENENTNFNPFQEFKSLIWSFEENVDVTIHDYKEEEEIKLHNTVVCIEKGTRAISRFFTHGFDNLGKQYINNFSSFLLLKDEDLGKMEYSKKKLSDSYEPLSRKSIRFLLIKLNSKAKKLISSDFQDWAFNVESVTVYSHKENFFFVEIDGEVFSLTGKTTTNFQIPNYFASKKRKPREYALYLLDEAQKLV